MINRHIFIIGMPGCGKSSLGRKVASNLGLPYVDTDQRIEQAAGCATSQIFERYGEQAFRNAETNVLIQLTREPGSIVSTGGGMVMREVNREIMRNHGVIVLIDRPLEEIMGDIKLNRRPLLAKKGLGEVERLYHERIDIYRSVADAVLDNSHGYHAGLAGMEKLIRTMFNISSGREADPNDPNGRPERAVR
ncbi:MAG: shikimate kinase [Clostridia bacterium]|nr:shikimate kinase [Clostridia bacterium]